MKPRKPRSPRRELVSDASFGKAYDGRLLLRLWPFVRPHRKLFVASALSYPITSVLHLIQPFLVKVGIDDHLVPKKLERFWMVVAGFVVAMLLEYTARFLQAVVTQLLGQRATQDLRNHLFHKLQFVDLAYIEKNPVGRLMTRVTNDVESLAEMFSTGAVSIIGDVVTLVGIVTMMLILDVKLTLVSFSVLPVLLVVVMIFRKYARETFREVRAWLARINAFLNEAISGLPIIQGFRQEPAMLSEFEDINASHRDANIMSIRFDAMTYAIVEGIATLSIAAMLYVSLVMIGSGGIEIGVFVAFVEYLRRFFNPITELSTKYTVLQSAMASAERCIDLMDQEPAVRVSRSPEEPTIRSGIALERVTFSYGATSNDVLKDLTFAVKRGEKVALVGPTGSGKSTIVKLLGRFYDPSAGAIRFDGLDLRNCDPRVLRKRMAVVLQDPYLFDGTIRENIEFGEGGISQEVLDVAAERTQASEVIRRQRDGWETQVGERGGRLSAGERQLITFARALIRDPELLVLDEATSAVDPETEALIQRGLKGLIHDRTAIIVAHRLSTIRNADRIIVLVSGRIVEEGSHDVLMKKGGVYRNLYELQFQEDDGWVKKGEQLVG